MPDPSFGSSNQRATVFEAANSQRREIYVAWTFLPIFDATARLGEHPPSVIAHWRPEREQISLRSLEFDLTEEEARAFVARYVAKPPQEGWKYIVEPPGKPRPISQRRLDPG